jgi:hypothetical protein
MQSGFSIAKQWLALETQRGTMSRNAEDNFRIALVAALLAVVEAIDAIGGE